MRLVAIAVLALTFARPADAQLAAPNALGVTYGHVHLSVSDVELQKKLWVEHFGGVITQKGPLVAVKLPGMLIAFRNAKPTGGSEGTVMDHIGFKVRNLKELLDKWRAAGYPVQSEFKGAEGFPNAYIIFPDDLRVELQEDTSLPTKTAAYHVHFILQDHLKLRDWYVENFGATTRKRGNLDTADVPGMNLSFSNSDKPRTTGTKGRVIDHIGFEIDGLEAFNKKLESRGIKFDTPFRNVPAIELNISYLTDPAGVYIELTEGYDKY